MTKAVDNGKCGRVVFTFYNLCEVLWGSSPAVRSVSSGIDLSLSSEDRGLIDEKLLEMNEDLSLETHKPMKDSDADISTNDQSIISSEDTKKRRENIATILKV